MHARVRAHRRADEEALGIRTLDLAKRLLDHGFHPPTVYFPLLVDEALLIEPTETETRETLDAFADTIGEILAEAAEDPEIGAQRALHHAGPPAGRGRRGQAPGHPPGDVAAHPRRRASQSSTARRFASASSSATPWPTASDTTAREPTAPRASAMADFRSRWSLRKSTARGR